MLESIPVVVVIVGFLYILFRLWALRRRDYWAHRNVESLESSVIFGHFGKAIVLNKSLVQTCTDLYQQGFDHPFIGVNIFHKPALFIRDPTLARRILTEDGGFFGDG